MNVRCFRCGWSFALSRDAVAAALAYAATTGARHHDERCPRCRQVLKISVDQLKRTMSPGWTPPPVEAQPAPAAPAESLNQTAEVSAATSADQPSPATVAAAPPVPDAAPAPARPSDATSSQAHPKPRAKPAKTPTSKAKKPAAKATAAKNKRKTSAK